MNRKALDHLLKRYLEDDCTEEEKKLVEQWYELLGDEDGLVTASDEEIRDAIQRVWPAVYEHTVRKPRPLWRWMAAAAVLAALVTGLFWFAPRSEMHTTHANARNDTVYLPDGSLVVLATNARLHYPNTFAATREVYLEGDAFFKVTKDPSKPFLVHSGNIVTRVLGTSFYVSGNANIEVSVRTGKVAVYEQLKDSEGVILKPNQKVIYNAANHRFNTTLVEAPLPVAPDSSHEVTALNFDFIETPISTVVKQLENAYHIDMVLENEGLAGCLFTGDIKGQDLYGQLEIICQSVQATYEIQGTRILIKGVGCN